MTHRLQTVVYSLAFAVLSVQNFGSSATAAPLAVTIDASRHHAPISPYIYGQFIEHIGDIINDGMWAEMLDDRKFYHPVIARQPKQQEPRALRRWLSVGPLDAVEMTREHAYAGKLSPEIHLSTNEIRGIAQSGIVIEKDGAYTGRIVVKAEREIELKVALLGQSGTSATTIPIAPGDYQTYRFELKTAFKDDNARLQISARGHGSLWLGAVSLMPADNLQGFRPEVIGLLKSLNSGVYRFPGGNFVSAHDWRNAVGDMDKRPPILDPVWNAVQPNDVGTAELITLSRLLEVEPYITVNAGFGDAFSAAQLVEYANGSPDTPMGKLRAKHGYPEPFDVKYWGVGNEAWGSWQMGAMALHQFVIKHDQFAEAMLAVDPSIKLIGSGAMPDSMTCSGESKKRTGKILTEYLSPADWTGGLFKHNLAHMDFISEHFYTYATERCDITTGEPTKLKPDEPLVDWMRRPANHVKVKTEAYDDYLALIPELKKKSIPIVLAEWAYSQIPATSYKITPAYAWVFHEMIRHSDLFYMANFTFATSLVSTNPTAAVLTPAGLMFRLYANEFGRIPVLVEGNSPQGPAPFGPGGMDPEVNAGSPTFPLDVVAALTEDQSALTVAVINPTEAKQRMSVAFEGLALKNRGHIWKLAPDDINAKNVVGAPPEVQVMEFNLTEVPSSIELEPWSVTLYKIETGT